MATKIRRTTSNKQKIRFKRKARIRAKLEGSASLPRLSVFRSNANMYAQLVDDVKGVTLVSASSLEEGFNAKSPSSVEGAKAVGELLAKKAIAKKIESIIFDRSGYLYHGRIKALADGAREGGLKF
jgi:large subunit ribosomal protein L18